MLTVYVLKLENRKFYVGRTYKNVYDRVIEHCNGEGSGWTKIHKPEELIYFRPEASGFDADLLVKKYMDEYGINNVRGGTYSSVHLSREQYGFIQAELDTANGTKTVQNSSPKRRYNKKPKEATTWETIRGYVKNLI